MTEHKIGANVKFQSCPRTTGESPRLHSPTGVRRKSSEQIYSSRSDLYLLTYLLTYIHERER